MPVMNQLPQNLKLLGEDMWLFYITSLTPHHNDKMCFSLLTFFVSLKSQLMVYTSTPLCNLDAWNSHEH